jgi:hypothetical protein
MTVDARARPLDADTCSQLDREKANLETGGVLTDIHATAEQAKQFDKVRLDKVQRYVEVSAQLLFRCLSAPANEGDTDQGAAAAGADQKASAKPRSAPKKVSHRLKR